jgi:hypothetical protein
MDGVKRNWRSRKGREVQHTREVRSELPDDVRTMIVEMQGEISRHSLQIIELKMQLADVSAALADYVRRVA